MVLVEIDSTTFEHALRNLTMREIYLILQQYKFEVDSKQTKSELITYLMNEVKKNNLNGDMYYTFREKAFSINKNFHDGFFYKIDDEYVNFNIKDFEEKVKERAKKFSGDVEVKVDILQVSDELMIINYERVKKDWAYDFSEKRSRAYRQLINADIEVYVKQGLVYIHSKNLTDSKVIKTFLDKCFLSLEVNKEKKKKVLSEPRFDIKKAEEWYENNKDDISFKVNGISLHMLDLFYQFEADDSKFSSVCMRRIYFKENIIYTENDEASITDMQYGGINLQQHIKIINEIKEGKRILGFSLEAEHCYEDEETGDETSTVLPITILYEDKNYLRLSISSECLVNVKERVLKQAYDDIKELFMNKYLSKCIFNTEKLKEYLVDVDSNEKSQISGSEIKSFEDKKEPPKSRGSWSL